MPSSVPIVSSGFDPISSQRPTGSGSSPKPKSERKLFGSTTSRRGSYSPLLAAARMADRVSATGPGRPSADDGVVSEPPQPDPTSAATATTRATAEIFNPSL